MTQKPEWVLVPREPTEKMLDGYWHSTGESREMRSRTHARGQRIYADFLAASPSPEASELSNLQKLQSAPLTLPPVPGVDREVAELIERTARWMEAAIPRISDPDLRDDAARDVDALRALVSPLEGKGNRASSASLPAHGAPQSSAPETEATCDLEALDPKRWEVSVNVDGTNVLTIGSHGYLAGYHDIDRFGDAVRAAGEHLLSFIGTGEPTPCFACGGSGRERWLGECGEEVGPCSVCQPEGSSQFPPVADQAVDALSACERDECWHSGKCAGLCNPADHSASVAAAERSEAGCAGNLSTDEPKNLTQGEGTP
jgi:hypothetical protein